MRLMFFVQFFDVVFWSNNFFAVKSNDANLTRGIDPRHPETPGKFIKDFAQSWSWILDLGVAVVVVAALSRES